MSAEEADDKAKKAARKAKLRAEAEKLGVSYEELKAQKKEKKEKKKKKRTREADALAEENAEHDGGAGREQEKRRMRSWSGEFADEPKGGGGGDGAGPPATKRLRTRSMDKAEETAKVTQVEKSQSTEEWRKSHNITIRGYGKNADEKKFPDPFIEFDDAPFNPVIQKTLKAAGFERPTFVQSQVSKILIVWLLGQSGFG